MYGHQDRRNKKKQEKREECEEEEEYFDYDTELEISASEAEEAMQDMFQLRANEESKGNEKGTKEKEMENSLEQGGTKTKKLADEAMMNITHNDIATETAEAVLEGGSPPVGPVLELPYTGHVQCS